MFQTSLLFFLGLCLLASVENDFHLKEGENNVIVEKELFPHEVLVIAIKRTLNAKNKCFGKVHSALRSHHDMFIRTFNFTTYHFNEIYDEVRCISKITLSKELSKEEASENMAYKILYVINEVLEHYGKEKIWYRCTYKMFHSRSSVLTWVENFIHDHYQKNDPRITIDLKNIYIEAALSEIIQLYNKKYKIIEKTFSDFLNSMYLNEYHKRLFKVAINNYNNSLDIALEPITKCYIKECTIKYGWQF
ncbi:hypothetical protein SLOPH_1161 [Spraguea lophii 42_110]|uniref:Uncharacterized protein n=1 Tax=Spraguea lophii (strain 42_110) TaxID=1358809 RepID=S7W9L0_SPRLO|nr:hypothetical protein SLOPH_1161 [Spraguea lophii 42_110]